MKQNKYFDTYNKKTHDVFSRGLLVNIKRYALGILDTIAIVICGITYGIVGVMIFVPIKTRRSLGNIVIYVYYLAVNYIHGINCKIIGVNNVPLDNTKYIVASNHQSVYEIIIIQLVFMNVVWAVKRSIISLPIFGWGILAFGHISVYFSTKNKQTNLRRLLKSANIAFKKGSNVSLFPEGTRVGINQYPKFKQGYAVLASLSHAYVIPVAHNSSIVWPVNSLRKQSGTVICSIGPKIATSGLDPQEINNKVSAWINAERRLISTGYYEGK